MTHTFRMRPTTVRVAAITLSLFGAACAGGEGPSADSADGAAPTDTAASAAPCAAGNGGLQLAEGFCATLFADATGGPRHIAVAPNGDVFAQLMTDKRSAEAGEGSGGILAMRDTNGDGVADTSVFYGRSGGTGIGLFDGHLYVDETRRIVRYRLPQGSLVPEGYPNLAPEVIVDAIPTGGHDARNFAIGQDGAMYLNIGSRSNSCQRQDRGSESPGHDPCTELETRAGIWKFDARRTGQRPSVATRFASGIRNAMGIGFAPDGRLWATQHGRDQFFQNWPKLFDAKYSAENPAEELLQVNEGDRFGWPYCYYAVDDRKLVTAPEYGGDGKQDTRCRDLKGPVATFGGHWAPMSLLFYRGDRFPARYRDGVFIAFHGSWNRAPEPQAGYRVVFQPLKDGAASGPAETFADGFAGGNVSPQGATHRPVGLAEAPDGSIYVTDDKGGRIWKISHRGGQN